MCAMFTACVAVCAFIFVCETKGCQATDENLINEMRLSTLSLKYNLV